MRRIWPYASLLIALAVTPVAAEEQGFSVGLGVGFGSSPYVDEDSDAQALPILRYQGNGWRIGTDGAGVDLYSQDPFQAEAILQPRFSALDDPDSDALDGIDREITLDGGLSFSYSLGARTEVSARFLQELTGEHDGQEVDLALSTGLALGPVPLSIAGGMSWKSGELGSYLYGVERDEATDDRPAYELDGSVTPYLSLSSGYPISNSAQIVGSVRMEFLPDEVTDSPIVDDDTVTSGFLGVQLSF